MAELVAADVELYTKGRLPASDIETTRILNRALAAARRYCEWHVTPIRTNQTVTLDGPGHRVLMLPTMKLQALNSVTEYDASTNAQVTVDPTTIAVSAGGPVRLRKMYIVGSSPTLGPGLWGLRWTHQYSGIVVNMDHGYVESDAEDFRLAVLDACDRFSLEVARGGMQRFHVDDVMTMWFEKHDVMNWRLLEPYRLNTPG